jgi:fermentation-respiration switch protein FrsA (DUF1100 family)
VSATTTFTRADVEFPGFDGTRLRGWRYLPDRATPTTPVPGVVMAHGFSAVKEMGLEALADALARAGFAVLVYDHRNLGASDGEPRQEIDIWAQARDYRAAFDRLAAEPAVAADRIALWGSSFSGGQVLVLAAADRRVAAVIAQVPFAGTAEEYSEATLAGWPALRDALLSGTPGTSAPPYGPIAVVTPTEGAAAFLADRDSWTWFSDEGDRPGSTWRNECTIRNDGGPVPFDPGLAVAHVAPTPLLMIVADDDRVAPAAIALGAFARAGEPKELLVVPGHHFVPYGDAAFDQCRDATIAFLGRHLHD